MFSSRSFIVFGLIFMFLIHFEFIFVYGARKCSNFILSYKLPVCSVALIEETIFLPLYVLVSFVIDELTIGVLVYFRAFYTVPLIYISVFMLAQYCFDNCSFVVLSEVREPDFSISVFQYSLNILYNFLSDMWFTNIFSHSIYCDSILLIIYYTEQKLSSLL